MSIVTVHGPNTWGTPGAGGGGGGNTITNAGGTVTADMTNGLKFTFAGAGDRAAADYDWSFGGTPAAQADTKNGTVTFPTAGAKVITLTVGSSAGTTPAPGTYTFNVTAISGPREVEGTQASIESANDSVTETPTEPEPQPTEPEPDPNAFDPNYDPYDHTVPEVVAYVEANPNELEDILALERDGQNRITLINQLESMRP